MRMLNLKPVKYAALLFLMVVAGCTDAVVWYTKEEATWSFIQKRCDGIQLGEIAVSAKQIAIPLRVQDKYDSAVCMYDAKGRVSGNRIEVSFKTGLCSGNAIPPLVARIGRPKAGDYQIVYADPGANYPLLGNLHVD